VPEEHQDKRSPGNQADPAQAGGDMLERAPALGQKSETAPTQAARRAQKRIPGTGITRVPQFNAYICECRHSPR